MSQFIDSIVSNIYTIKPGDKIEFKNEGKIKTGILVTKLGMWWQVKGDDGRNYVYQSIVRMSEINLSMGGLTMREELLKKQAEAKIQDLVREFLKIQKEAKIDKYL